MSWLYSMWLRSMSERQLREKRAELFLARGALLAADGSVGQLVSNGERMRLVTRELVRRGLLRSM